MQVVLLWPDAFSDRYLSPSLCPFLWSISREHFFSRISPLFAYSGIEYCFRTGVSINTHGIWNDHFINEHIETEWRLSGKIHIETRWKNMLFKGLLHFVDKISLNDDVNKALRYLIFKIFNIDYGIPHLIPANLIDLFPVVRETYLCSDLYRILEENNIKYIKIEPKFNIVERYVLRKVPKLLKCYDFILIKLNSLDRLRHRYGPLSNELKYRLRYLDNLLKKTFECVHVNRDAILMVMSDHGMTPVFNTIDLIHFLEKNGFKYGKQYIAFIGATYASFWFRNEEYKNIIKEKLNMLGVGKFLTPSDKIKLGIDGVSEKYGEEIFAIREHYVFFPEFYHRRVAPRGMHGYAFSRYDMPIFLMYGDISVTRRKDKIDFIDIMPTILRLLDLPVPSHIKGRPLL